VSPPAQSPHPALLRRPSRHALRRCRLRTSHCPRARSYAFTSPPQRPPGRLRQPADPLAPLPLPPRAFLALIRLLRAVRHAPLTPTRSGETGAAAAMEVDGAARGGGAEAAGAAKVAARGPGRALLPAYACALEAGLCRVEVSSRQSRLSIWFRT
jgi:hypothetical protein